MNRIARDFVSQESRSFSFKLGSILASALSGFIVGVIASSMVWLIGAWYLKQAQDTALYNLTKNPTTVSLPSQAPAQKPTTH